MLTHIHPRLPMRNKAATLAFYVGQLGFAIRSDYGNYLILSLDNIEVHFFEFATLDPQNNYAGPYIRTNNIDQFYQKLLEKGVAIHPNGALQIKPWGQKEFALLDPDFNLLTFGQEI